MTSVTDMRPPLRIRMAGARGFSLVEILVVIGIIGVLASVGMVAFSNIQERSRETVARAVVETLNRGTKEFGHSLWTLDYAANNASADDELDLLRTLQYRDQANPAHGAPYVRPDWDPAVSDSEEDYRIVWKGKSWDLLMPGTGGPGLLVDFDGSDMGDNVTFPEGFTMVGAN